MKKIFSVLRISFGEDEQYFIAPGMILYSQFIPNNAVIIGDSRYTVEDFMCDHTNTEKYDVVSNVYAIGDMFSDESKMITDDEMDGIASIWGRYFLLKNFIHTLIECKYFSGKNPFYIDTESDNNSDEE